MCIDYEQDSAYQALAAQFAENPEDYNEQSQPRQRIIRELAVELGADNQEITFGFWAMIHTCSIQRLECYLEEVRCAPQLFKFLAQYEGFEKFFKIWVQRLRNNGDGSGSAASESFPPSLTSSPAVDSSVGTSSITSASPSRKRPAPSPTASLRPAKRPAQGQASTSRPPVPAFDQANDSDTSSKLREDHKASSKSKKLARKRDKGRCALTGVDVIDICHIFPSYMLKPDSKTGGARERLWNTLAMFYNKQDIDDLKNLLFGDVADNGRNWGFELTSNLICLNPLLHRCWNRGEFVIKPVDLSLDKRTLTCRLIFVKTQPRGVKQTTIKISETPESLRGFDGTNKIITNDKWVLKSGYLFEMHTEDPSSQPLPDIRLLNLAYYLGLILRMSGAGQFRDDDDDDDDEPGEMLRRPIPLPELRKYFAGLDLDNVDDSSDIDSQDRKYLTDMEITDLRIVEDMDVQDQKFLRDLIAEREEYDPF